MGFIDSDTHVVECEHTWDFLDPDERECRPKVVNGFWRVEDLHYWIGAVIDRTHRQTFPTASVDLTDPSARAPAPITVKPAAWTSFATTNSRRSPLWARAEEIV